MRGMRWGVVCICGVVWGEVWWSEVRCGEVVCG